METEWNLKETIKKFDSFLTSSYYLSMTTITIPKKDIKDDLVIIPRKKYEELLRSEMIVKSFKTYTPTASEKRALARARKNLARGEYLTLKQLRNELGIKGR